MHWISVKFIEKSNFILMWSHNIFFKKKLLLCDKNWPCVINRVITTFAKVLINRCSPVDLCIYNPLYWWVAGFWMCKLWVIIASYFRLHYPTRPRGLIRKTYWEFAAELRQNFHFLIYKNSLKWSHSLFNRREWTQHVKDINN